MTFDMGIWDTVFMVAAIGAAIWSHLANRRSNDTDDGADE